MKKVRQKKNTQAGFTLIELMVVIVILGLLAGVIIPRFMGETDKAKVATTKIITRIRPENVQTG
jgi:general secretion pathway protein G